MIATNLEKAWAAWGKPPEWVVILAKECDRTSQRSVADRLAISSSVVTRLISRTYGASHDGMEELVRAVIAKAEVECPAFGAIPLTSCIRNRRRKGPATNSLQRTFERHCPRCPLNPDRNLEEEDHGE
jgi:hypothetical protein